MQSNHFKLEMLKSKLSHLKRKAWKPIVQEGDGAITASKLEKLDLKELLVVKVNVMVGMHSLDVNLLELCNQLMFRQLLKFLK